ncbi:MAG: ATP-binding protein, partial [Thermoanaerobaculum sp.]
GPCNIAGVLEETLDLFTHSSELGPNHRIERRIVRHEKPVVADEQQLRQAFFNLARNAIQAMPGGGTLTVEALPDGAFYVVRFADEGEGMDPERIQEIFQPFKAFRKGGTGLGLAVVYSIVSDHGGEVKVESQPGQGSVFTLSIPMREV